MNSLFVYGTLCQGYPNEHILKKIGGTFQNASVRGLYVNAGWGIEMGCPALILNATGKQITGQVFTSTKLNNHLSQLDEFEGDEYRRVISLVKLECGKEIEAYIYVAS